MTLRKAYEQILRLRLEINRVMGERIERAVLALGTKTLANGYAMPRQPFEELPTRAVRRRRHAAALKGKRS